MAGEHEEEFTPEQQLGGDLTNLAMGWRELGIDPDDFLRCADCHQFFIDEDGRSIPCACN